MQYLKHKRLEITVHLVVWLLIFIFPVLLYDWGQELTWKRYLHQMLLPVSCAIVFYVNYLYLIPFCLFTKRTGKYLLLNIVLILMVNMVLHYSHESLIERNKKVLKVDKADIPPPPRMRHIWTHFIMLNLVAGSSIAIRMNSRWHYAEKKLLEVKREKTEAELKNLKYQMNPHFLLNTLNNIYALIEFDSRKAQNAVQELAKLLRHVLYENHSAKIPLKRELEFIQNYIALMQIRLLPSVNVSVKLDAGEVPIFIEPLLFISLIENAFKHGVSPTEKSFIHISIQGYPDGKVVCEIKNSNFPKNSTDKSGSGIGLAQLSSRLDLTYPGNYEWIKEVSDDGRTYFSRIMIKTK